ncbi:hypothetical protein DY000_02032563 [Brassica cretica]|uniref:Uncharacterized protein n=1 Tax=Brassica cretica TaxID=69181 RepID=A0ABQ7DG48_BRACR|nr:hypothetical protein DY000_02032563 [Brassica cretica]
MDSAYPPSLSGSVPELSLEGGKDQEGVSEDKFGSGSEKDLKRQEITKPKAASWVDVAQETKVLKKYNLNITDLEGKLNVEIPNEVVINTNPLWDLDTTRHIARIHAVMNKICRDGGKGQGDVEYWKYTVGGNKLDFR